MFCPKCGAKLPDNTRYCVQCGTELDAAPARPIPKVPPLAEPAKRPRKKIAIAVTAIILVLALLAGGIAVLWNRGQSPAADPYYMSRCLLTDDGDTAFDVTYTADGKMESFYWTFNGKSDAFTLTPVYDEDGKLQTLTYKGVWVDTEYVYQFSYEAGQIPGTNAEGMIGTDPTDPSLCLYYDADNKFVGMSARQDAGAEGKLILDSQHRLQFCEVKDGTGGWTADFKYDANGNLTYIHWPVINLFIPLDSMAGDIVTAVMIYQFWNQFPNFSVFLSLVEELLESSSFTMQLQYQEGRVSGGSYMSDSSEISLVQESSTETSDTFKATIPGETLYFPITIQYNEGRISKISVDFVDYEDGMDSPVPLVDGIYGGQGHEISVTLFDPYGSGVPVLELQKTWTPREQ